jgi:hypothetical protein
MKVPPLSLASLLLFAGAIPIWVSLTFVVIEGVGFGQGVYRYFLAPVALLIASVAIYRLLRRKRHAAAFSMLLAGVVLFGAVAAAAVWARYFS